MRLDKMRCSSNVEDARGQHAGGPGMGGLGGGVTVRGAAAVLLALMLAGCAAAPDGTAEDVALQHARKLLRSTILVDGHNDLPYAVRGFKDAPGDIVVYDLRKPTPGDTDLARLRAGGLGAQFW